MDKCFHIDKFGGLTTITWLLLIYRKELDDFVTSTAVGIGVPNMIGDDVKKFANAKFGLSEENGWTKQAARKWLHTLG